MDNKHNIDLAEYDRIDTLDYTIKITSSLCSMATRLNVSLSDMIRYANQYGHTHQINN